jgi:DNA recombination protein RmuC
MQSVLLIIIVVLLVAVIILLLFKQQRGNQDKELLNVQKTLAIIEAALKEDFRFNRNENDRIAREGRMELQQSLSGMNEHIQNALSDVHKTLAEHTRLLMEKTDQNNQSNRQELAKNIELFSSSLLGQLGQLQLQSKEENRLNRETMQNAITGFQDSFNTNIRSFNELQREKFSQLQAKQAELVTQTEVKLENIRVTVEEKLEKTLSERLGQSFETVGNHLIQVQKGLGEMQTLAQDVGGLKRVLSNVKMRGGFGEVQLHMLLENILAPDQFEANVITKKGGNERVEFAVKFPNKAENRDYVWLPVDAKFPKDAYEYLQDAYDTGDIPQIESAQKNLEQVIKKMAKDICTKYIDPPNTTNFGIMFLPFEGLFAEVVRKASLLEEVQRDCNVIITGPTTLAVILNSLQMGFRTLAIQKRSGEVWEILGSVKKEFALFGGLLDKAQKNIQNGLKNLDEMAGARTRAIQKRLRNVEILENGLSDAILPPPQEIESDDPEL